MTVKVTREAEPQIELYGAYSGQLDGNGRVSLTFTATDTYLIMVPKNSVSRAQLEAGSFATSYIPTAAATVTRNADVASVGVSQFPYSATEGTLITNVQTADKTAYVAQFSDGTSSNFIAHRQASSGTALVVTTSGSSQANIGTTALTAKIASAFKTDDFATSVNGGAVATDTAGTLPTVSQLRIGSQVDGTAFVNGWIRQITYIPRRLTNAELISRTA